MNYVPLYFMLLWLIVLAAMPTSNKAESSPPLRLCKRGHNETVKLDASGLGYASDGKTGVIFRPLLGKPPSELLMFICDEWEEAK